MDLIEINPKQLDELNEKLELCLRKIDTMIRVVPTAETKLNSSGEALKQEGNTGAKDATSCSQKREGES